jgi:hypothetical protein
MCNPGPHFKFCTCSPEKLGETYWKLSRGSTFETVNYVGSLAPPLDAGTDYFFSAESFVIDRLLFDLNNNPVFDFDYIPEDGDYLQIYIGDVLPDDIIGLGLIYTDGKFSSQSGGQDFNDDGTKLGIGELKYIPKS